MSESDNLPATREEAEKFVAEWERALSHCTTNRATGRILDIEREFAEFVRNHPREIGALMRRGAQTVGATEMWAHVSDHPHGFAGALCRDKETARDAVRRGYKGKVERVLVLRDEAKEERDASE